MGLMGIQLKIALKDELPKEFEMIDSDTSNKEVEGERVESTVQVAAENKEILNRNESVESGEKNDG
jgi:hypothetical protein